MGICGQYEGMTNIKPWVKKELKDKRDFKGTRHKGSGNYWAKPGDVSTPDFLIDAKHTEHASYSITKKIWNKIYEEALFMKRIPILSLEIQTTELVVLSKSDFLAITKKGVNKFG